MRKLEGVVKEILDEMEYLRGREERFQATNSASSRHLPLLPSVSFAHLVPITPTSARMSFLLTLLYISSIVSTNKRVQNFAWFMFASLFGLGVWQIFHLRAFFKRKYLID